MWHTTQNPAFTRPAADLPATPAWVRFDFNVPQTIVAVRIWNHNQANLTDCGFRKARLFTSADGTTWESQAIEIPRGTGEMVAFPLAVARPIASIIIAAETNYGGDTYGLSAVRFMVAREVAPEDLPFPTSLECMVQDYYGHRSDGEAGRAVVLHLTGAKLYGNATVATRCAGDTEQTSFNNLQGADELTVLLPAGAAVTNDCPATFTLRLGSRSVAKSVIVPAKRQWTIYIYPHAHVDIGYTAPQDIAQKIHMRNVDVGIDLGRKTANYPEGARHVWNPESEWVVESYLREATPEKKAAFIHAVKQGWICLDANYDNANTSAFSDEEFIHYFRNAIEMRKLTGQPVDTMVQVDVPGMSWGVVEAAAQCGVRGVFNFPNHVARIGTIREAWEQKPFWWVAPDGKSRVLFIQGWPYGMGYVLKGSKIKSPLYKSPADRYPESLIGRIPSPVQEYRKDVDRISTDDPSANFLDPFIFTDTARLEREGSPYDIYVMTWSMADNSLVDADLPDAVKAWNEKYAYPKLVISGAHDIMTAFEKKYGGIIPEVRSDYTEYWTDGLGTDARRTGYNRLAKERLIQAETLWTMLHGDSDSPAPVSVFNNAWRWVMLGSEHTWGYYNPDVPFAKHVEATKASYFENADKTSRQLLAQTVEPITKPGSETFAVLNSLSWNRTGLVTVQAAGGRVLDDQGAEVPSQRLTTGELAFLASEVPALGSRAYRVTPGGFTGPGCKIVGNTLDNGLVKVTLNPQTGDIASLICNGHEFVDAKSPYSLNSYRYLLGADKPTQATGPTDVVIKVKETGPLVVSLVVESKAGGCNKLTREIRLIAGQPWVGCFDTLDKISTRVKEGVHFGFAFNVPGGTTRMDIPWGVMTPERDQIPGANRNWLVFQRWVDISNDKTGVTWTAIEAPLVEFGNITANVLGDALGAQHWLAHLPETQTVISWALNNHWFTNFPLEQGGIIPFHYVILPHAAYDPVKANQFGVEQNRPLLAIPVAKNPVDRQFLVVDNPRVFVSTLKPSEDGKASILRLRSLSDKPETVRLTWPAGQPKFIYHCLADEIPAGGLVGSSVNVLPWGAVILRIER